MDQSIEETPVSSRVFAALLKKPSNASFCTVQVLAPISYLGEYAVYFSSKFSERSPRTRESRETREASAAAREEKKDTASTARANEICVVLAMQKYDRLMLIINIIIVVVVFVAPLTLSVWVGRCPRRLPRQP